MSKNKYRLHKNWYQDGNNNEAFIPQLWANEGLAILEETMVLGNLVYRDFENVIAKYGDVVNTRKPRTFTAYRKTDSDPVTIQNAISDNIPVPLNQHLHTSFMIMDRICPLAA
jgi:P22 coat protein - gene protein 5